MLTLPPVKGEISLAGVFPFAGVGGSARRPPEREAQPTSATPPLGGRDLDHLSRKLPYPRSPALCRKDTTYPWSNRLRSNSSVVIIIVIMIAISITIAITITITMIIIIMVIIITLLQWLRRRLLHGYVVS